MEISPEIDRLLREAKRRKSMKPEMIETIKEEIQDSLQGVNAINEVFKRIELLKIKGDKGDKGEKGEPGINGKDGVNGINGKDGRNGVDGKDGKDGARGLRGLPGKDGKDGKNGRDGIDGKDGSPDTKYEIRDKLASLRGNERLDAKAIKNLAREVGSVTFTGMGGGTSQTVTEHIADTLIHVPIYIQDTEPSNPSLNDLWVDTSS